MKLLCNDQKGLLVLMGVLIGSSFTTKVAGAPRGAAAHKKQSSAVQVDAYRSFRVPKEFHADAKMVDVAADMADGLNLEQTFGTIIDTAKERGTFNDVPRGLVMCYEQLKRGSTKLCKDDFDAAASYIVDKLSVDVRSGALFDCARKDCRAGGRGQGVVLDGRRFKSSSLGLDSDNFQIGKFLCCIKRTLNKVNRDLNECCEELKQDFRQTWELLEEIDMDLQDATCELKTDLHECCEQIQEDFRKTWHKLGDDEYSIVPTKHLPDFVLKRDCEWDIDSCEISKECAFDEINHHKASIFEWLKMIYILTRNINNKLIGPTYNPDCTPIEPNVERTSGPIDWV